MKTKNEKTLPKTVLELLNGGIYVQEVRCGKNSCRCAKGAKHKAYYYFSRIGGKLRKQYVRKDQVERFKRFIARNRNQRKQSVFAQKISKEISKKLSAKLREYANVQSALKENGYE